MNRDATQEKELSQEALQRRAQDYERWFRTLDAQMRVLERERQKLSAVVNHTDAGFVLIDSSLRTVWANEVFATLLEGEEHAGSVLGGSCNKLLCRRDEVCEECPAVSVFQTGEVAHHEIRLEQNGQPRHIYATAMPIKTPEGRIDETMVMLQDVSDLAVLRRSREALRASEERFRSIFERAAAGMATVSPDGCFLQVNPAFCSFLGYAEAELLEMKIADITHPSDVDVSLRALDEARTGSRTTFEIEKRYVRKDGVVVWGRTSVVWLFDHEGRPTFSVALVQDITGRKKTEEALRQSEEALERSEEQLRQAQKLEAVGTLAGGVAHDFNNILTGILGYSEMLKLQGSQGDAIHQAAEVIGRAARRGAELTQQLLGFARKGRNQNVPVDLRSTLREVTDLLQRTIDKRIRISCRFGGDPAVVVGDPGQIQQVFVNLAINARDAMPEGGEMVFVTEIVHLDAQTPPPPGAEPGDHVKVSVTDTGLGIPAALRERIFEPFFTTKERGKGTGMGLAMVYGIVRSHGGAISVRSEVGRGTTFEVYFPAAPESVAALAAAEPAPMVEGRGHGRILVVDDEEFVRDVAEGFLTHLGYEVITAQDGDRAIEIYTRAPGAFDLVILDMVMPRTSGRDCFHALKRLNPDVRAIMASGYAFNVVTQELIDEGMLGFVQKPYTIEQLSHAVLKALGRPVPS